MPHLKRIVVVDDDIDVHDLVSAYFKPRGFQIICYDCAETAIHESLITGTSWDVLLTDFHFPNMTGIEFTVKIKKNLPQLPVILITPVEAEETAIQAIQHGAYDFVTKPIHFLQLQTAVERALHLKTLSGDISDLREIVKTGHTSQSKIVGKSPEFLKALDIAQRVAKSSANIFILGESGTGKEVFSRFIHAESTRAKGPFVAINCSAIPEALLESELFGHAKGSFTGALAKKIGLFEEAEDGTLFLDEIGDLSLPLQAKLLRVLQEKNIKRVGENQYRPINCRIVCATHKNMAEEVNSKRFREDLYFRLNVIPIKIPPLRDRPEDILPLAETFLRKYALENASPAKYFSKEAIHFILENKWRGNVRELENSVERAVVLSSSKEVRLENFMPTASGLGEIEPEVQTQNGSSKTFSIHYSDRLPTLAEVTQHYIEYAISVNDGARDRTAKEIGIDRKTLSKRMRPHTASSLQNNS